MISKIGDTNVYIGDLEDAVNWDYNKQMICVLEERPESEPSYALHIPILQLKRIINEEKQMHEYIQGVLPQQLDLVNDLISKLSENDKLLVHCGAGQERSPLAVAHWLMEKDNITIEEAYKEVKKYRPQTIEHLEWLNTFDSKYGSWARSSE